MVGVNSNAKARKKRRLNREVNGVNVPSPNGVSLEASQLNEERERE